MMVAAVSTRERWVLVRVGIFRGSVVVGVVRLAFVVRTRLKGDQGKMRKKCTKQAGSHP